MVTGANSGLGFEAAKEFAALGADKVILGVRDLSKGAVAAKKLEESTGRSNVADVWELDMSSYNSIRAFASRIASELKHLDVAVLNAGVTNKQYIVGSEGWELTLQVNLLSTTLLGYLLLPSMKTAPGSDLSHLVFVTSENHRWLEDKDIPNTSSNARLLDAVNAAPQPPESWDGWLQNARSKLFLMYSMQSLAQLAKNPQGEIQTVVTSVCPGACKSELGRDFNDGAIGTRIFLTIFDLLFQKPAEIGARAYVLASFLGDKGHGKWYKTNALTT